MAGMHFLMRPTSTCSTDKNSIGSRFENTCVQEGKTVPNARKTNSKCRRSDHSNVSEDEIHSYQTERRRGGGGGGRASVGDLSEETEISESGRFPQVQARDSWDSLMTLSRGDITCTLSSEVSFSLSWICCVSQLICECDCICHHL